jgi:hypothetical protein
MLGTRLAILITLFSIASSTVIADAQAGQGRDRVASARRQDQQQAKGDTQNRNRADTGSTEPFSAANPVINGERRDCNTLMNVAVEPQTAEKPNSSDRLTFRSALWNWLFGWPFMILVILAFFTAWPGRLALLLRPFESLKLFGAEFVLNRIGGEEVEDRLAKLRKREQEKFDREINEKGLSFKHHRLVDEYIRPNIEQFAYKNIRATIHVQDLLFEDGLYQLLDYYPNQRLGGRGRSFSSRTGIIGKAWRLAKSQYAAVVPTNEEELILHWGMTSAEAPKAGHGRHSFACVVLKSGAEVLGLLYFDSPVEKAFGENDSDPAWHSLERAITKGAIETDLIADLLKLNRELIRPSAVIRIFS